MAASGTDDVERLALVARKAAETGGEELLRWRGRFETRSKGPSDYVTDADVAAQAAIRAVLATECPDHLFVGEESADSNPQEIPNDRVCWVVDPLDGTTNYLHDFPSFAVSIAAVLDGDPIAGVILDPLRQEVFSASKGGGAWLNDERLETSGVEKLADALVAISLPASVQADSPDLVDFVRIAPRCQAVRRIGSAALNLAYVACGRLDAYWAREIHPWDIAAGILLMREAGGSVSDAEGSPASVWKPPCVASAGAKLHSALLSQLTPPT
ncbi:MAG: inositol monophosphatase family protein [Planctomycetota bacterium]